MTVKKEKDENIFVLFYFRSSKILLLAARWGNKEQETSFYKPLKTSISHEAAKNYQTGYQSRKRFT